MQSQWRKKIWIWNAFQHWIISQLYIIHPTELPTYFIFLLLKKGSLAIMLHLLNEWWFRLDSDRESLWDHHLPTCTTSNMFTLLKHKKNWLRIDEKNQVECCYIKIVYTELNLMVPLKFTTATAITMYYL